MQGSRWIAAAEVHVARCCIGEFRLPWRHLLPFVKSGISTGPQSDIDPVAVKYHLTTMVPATTSSLEDSSQTGPRKQVPSSQSNTAIAKLTVSIWADLAAQPNPTCSPSFPTLPGLDCSSNMINFNG